MDTLDKLLGEEGMKFDVTASISDETYFKIFVTIFGAVVSSVVVISLVGNALKS